MRYVEEGSGYVVTDQRHRRHQRHQKGPRSNPVNVTGLLHKPPTSLYTSQTLNNGFGYLRKTRDGTLLSVMVRLPGPPENGPYPTVVEYSGYDPANAYEFGGTTASTRIASLLGYATVGVNLRGSGCSGGSFQLWEDPVATDGYDAVETIARQPWVKNNKVGLVGLSYPGNAAAVRRRHPAPEPGGHRGRRHLRRRVPQPAAPLGHPQQRLRPELDQGSLRGRPAGRRRLGQAPHP